MQSFKNWFESNDEEENKWKPFLPHNRERQRTFPFAQEPIWNRKSDNYLEPWQKEEDFQSGNLYHVTTNLAGVRATGALLSRKQLGTEGLGGGNANVSPNLVSTTYSYNRALKIYEDIKYVCEIAQGKIPASKVLDLMLDNEFEEAIDEALKWYVPAKYLGENWDETKIKAILDRKIRGGKQIYEFYQELEKSIADYEATLEPEYFTPSSVTGFTADWETFAKIDPKQVAIIQVVARKGAPAENVPEEEEIRFPPKSLKIVRYLQP